MTSIKKLFLFIFPFFIFISCWSLKSPTKTKVFFGAVMACVADSTTIKSENEIRLKKEFFPRPMYCPNCKYNNCNNKPDYFDFVINWPGQFVFHFNKKTYFFLHNSAPFNPKLKPNEPGYGVQYDSDYGKI